MFRNFFEWLCRCRRSTSINYLSPKYWEWRHQFIVWYDGALADFGYATQTYLYTFVATSGNRWIGFGQYTRLCISLSYGCTAVEILEYDEKLRQLRAMIYGALCDYKKHPDQQRTMNTQRQQNTSRNHKDHTDSMSTYPSEPVSRGSYRGSLYRSNLCRRRTPS